MSQNRRLEEALRRTSDGTFPLDELHALIHEAGQPDEVARENWRDAVKVLDEIETLHRPLPYSFIDEDGASWPTKVCSSCRLGVMPQAWPCLTIKAMAGYVA